MIKIIFFLLITGLILTPSLLPAQRIDLTRAVILTSGNIPSPMQETVTTVISEEVKRRTGQEWTTSARWPGNTVPVIAIVLSGEETLAGRTVPKRKGTDLPEQKPEGFRIFTTNQNNQATVWIIGADKRGVLFGAGYLLRKTNFGVDQAWLEQSINHAASPQQSIRGHQLGYRNTANSYDAWNAAQYEKYIRELALFGTNAIENIPFGKSNDSVLMPISREEMNIRISEICARYDIDYWVWTPATFDLTDTEKRTAMLETHETFYKTCPRLDQIFFPGGDPGHNHPREVMPFLKDLSERLTKYHPRAGIWISLQGFSAEQIDYFYEYLRKNKPDWLRGVVSGPSSPPTAETRFRLPAQYQHRLYPDINHNVRCEYPVPNWDQAFALTIGREGINPRPVFFLEIHAKYAPFINGFVSYSDGVHDDVNKIIWSMRGWDLNVELEEILNDYCRFFFGPELVEKAANGILALERNWDGPIRENGGIETTLAFWQNLDQNNPQLKDNWRWQMLVLRAYYDAYQKRRKIYETGLEKNANTVLAKAPEIGATQAMAEALFLVNKAETEPVAQDLYSQIVKYCDDLFNSIGLQTSVPKYKASNAQRGCILDLVNHPFNNRWWLEDEFDKIKKMNNENEKLLRLETICNWESPGPGSYYDNVSDIENSPHVLTTSYDATDVAWWDNGRSRKRLSAQLFQYEPELQYRDLDFNGRYILRLCGKGDALVWADSERLEPILYNKEHGEFKEYVIPKHIIGDSAMHIVIERPEESHLNWRNYSHVSDVWLIKR